MDDLHDTNAALREAAGRLCERKGLEHDALLTRPETSAFLGVTTSTLAKLSPEELPYFAMFGRCRYRAIDVAMFFLRAQRPPSESQQARAVATRRARGDQLGRPSRSFVNADVQAAAA